MYRLLASIDRSGDHLFDIETEFIVNECGHFRLIKQEDYHRSRPCGRKDYQLLYVAEGCFVFPPQKRHAHTCQSRRFDS